MATGTSHARLEATKRVSGSQLVLCGVLAILVALVPLHGQRGQAPVASGVDDEEFVGPFPSWVDVTAVHRAAGDGATDDTAALQAALNAASGGSERAPVIYLPAGVYRITRTLTWASTTGVALVGADPATTSLVWDGEAGGTILDLNGVAYSRVSRLTFDGRKKAAVAVEQSWDGGRPHFDSGNEYTDVAFVDLDYGIRGGFRGHGFAETHIARARFIRNAAAGVALGNFNALDIWIRHALFEDCGAGVTNDPGAGNFRVYDSVFRRSRIADLMMQNTGVFSARGNYSEGSARFFMSGAPINHPANVDIQANTILDPIESTAIRLASQGPGALLDNVVRSRPGATAPVVSWRSFIDADMVSVGNTFTVSTPTFNNGRLVTFEDRVVARESIIAAEPRLPTARRRAGRQIFEVPAGAGAAAIQQALDRATASGAARAVVHLPFGKYRIERTLVAGGDVQVVGDGFRTVLEWGGAPGGPMVSVTGPARFTARDLMIRPGENADGVVVTGIDQPGSRVYLEGVQLRGGRQTNLRADGLAQAQVELVNVDHADSRGVSIKVSGSDVAFFSGASSNNALSYEASGGARVLVRDMWYEGDSPNGFLKVIGAARFGIQSSRVATHGMRVPSFSVSGPDAQVTLMTTHLDDQVLVDGNGTSARLLALGLFREFRETPLLVDRSSPPAGVLALNGRQRYRTQGRLSPGSVQVPDTGRPAVPFIREMLADLRARIRPRPLVPAPEGSSDIRLFRVSVEGGRDNLILR